ncbi:unnamed protein product [Symbiodinium sp. KB8]|nr:unnamed protein product [Symbiodinium sp. KB8]
MADSAMVAVHEDLAFEDEAVKDFIAILEEHRLNCERQGKYVEADIARARLDELRVHEENRRREAMRARQLAERLGVEEAHMLEFQQFNVEWDRRMADYEENAARLILAMKERHVAELREFQQKLIARATIPRHSKEYLNLRRIQDVLAKQKNYAEAAKIKQKADELVRPVASPPLGARSAAYPAAACRCRCPPARPSALLVSRALPRWPQMAFEEEKWNNERQAEMYQKEMRFKQKLRLELHALKKRIQQGKAEMTRQRQGELERLLQRYQNVKRELEQQQRMERVRSAKQSTIRNRSSK